MFTHWEGFMLNNYEEKLLKNQEEFNNLVVIRLKRTLSDES